MSYIKNCSHTYTIWSHIIVPPHAAAASDASDDRFWLCPRSYAEYVSLDGEERIRFLIGLSSAVTHHLNGLPVVPAIPPPRTVCRHCWALSSVTA